MSVGESLQQAGLLAAGRRSDGRCQAAQVRLRDLQGNICCRANVQLGCPHGVVPWRSNKAVQLSVSAFGCRDVTSNYSIVLDNIFIK